MTIRRRTPPLPLPDTTRMDLTTAELRHLATLARPCSGKRRPRPRRHAGPPRQSHDHDRRRVHRAHATEHRREEPLPARRPHAPFSTHRQNHAPANGSYSSPRPSPTAPPSTPTSGPRPTPGRRTSTPAAARPSAARSPPTPAPCPAATPTSTPRPPRSKRRAPANASPASPSSAPAGRPSSGAPPAGTAPASTVNYDLRALERKGWIQLNRGKDRGPGGGANQPEGSRAPQRPTLTSWMPSQLWQTRISV